MSIVRLGKMHLHWCDGCNVPIVEDGKCGKCGEEARKVEMTPPGDVRPAFEEDIELIRNTIDKQWGEGYSYELFSEGKYVILNGIPYIDRMDEVIVDGKVIGALRYNPKRKLNRDDPYEFILRPWKGLEKPEKGYVKVDEGAVKPILEGGSVLSPGIIDADTDVRENDETIVVGPSGEVICAGSARHSGDELVEKSSGRGVKSRWKRSENYSPSEKRADREDVLEANEGLIEDRVEESLAFIREQVDQHDLPSAVAYSGGKDSLATLHLLLDAGLEPDLLFIDTGIELPETKDNVEDVAEKYDLTVHKRKAQSGYWNNVDYFGPSARDYRWCCKTCKLGPTALSIDEHYPEGVLSFIGQRRYESRQRMSQGSTWDNPWVPGQVSASPIQEWTALHVWLYLFSKDADWNEWYEKGFERIGCWVCPASDLAEFERLKQEFSEFERFEKVLEEYAEERNLPDIWLELGLWRWKDIPDKMEKMIDEEIESLDEGETVERSVSEMLEDERTRNLLNSVTEVEEDEIEKLEKEKISDLHRKALNCVECGVCVGRCEQDAIYFDRGIKIDSDRCIHCGECLGKCPVVRFDSRVTGS